MNVVIVYNPRSGSAPGRQKLAQLFREAGIEIKKLIVIDETYEHALKAFIKKNQVIVAIGGDGTISNVAAQLVNTEAILAPLPGGTLNHFTKDVGVPQDLAEAIARLGKLKPTHVDVASVNTTYFLNNSSIGLYPTSLTERNYFEKKLGKWPAAVIGALRAFTRYKIYHATIGKTTFDTPFLFVGNGNYHFGEGEYKRKRLDEGKLHSYVAVTKSRWTLLGLVWFAIIGKLADHSAFVQSKSDGFTLHTRRRHVSVSHDGELSRLASPLTYKIHKKALRVLV